MTFCIINEEEFFSTLKEKGIKEINSIKRSFQFWNEGEITQKEKEKLKIKKTTCINYPHNICYCSYCMKKFNQKRNKLFKNKGGN